LILPESGLISALKRTHVNKCFLSIRGGSHGIIDAMYVESVPNRGSPPAILLRETYREDGKVKKRTLLNLSDWPRERVEGLRALLKGGVVMPPGTESLQVIRTLPHGHVSAVLGVIGKIGLDRLLGPHANRPRDLVLAMIVSRIIAPSSKLATTKGLNPMTATTSLGQILGLGEVAYDELYQALDWLRARQPAIETALARRHLKGGTLVLYDVSSSHVEGRCCPLAKRGYNRDGKKGKLQIVYGLLCAADGCPVAVEVFDGNTGDPKTLAVQIDKLKVRFGLAYVVLVGDRGMITQARIRQDVVPANLDWITALRAPDIKALAEDGKLQLTLFDERNMAVITSPDFPSERLIVCRNPDLTAARTRKRNDLLAATERDLAAIKERVERKRAPLHGADKIGIAVGAVLGRHKMAKHFQIEITDDRFAFCRNKAEIAAETARDGIYVIRTNLPADAMSDPQVVASYKSLSQVERAFRSIKTVDLEIRPIYHWLEDRVRAHVLLCMLAYHLEWHMRGALAPMLYEDDEKEAVLAERSSPVAKAPRSDKARAKEATHRTADGLPVHSFQSLIADLGTLCLNTLVTATSPDYQITIATRPTPIQAKAFELLGVPALPPAASDKAAHRTQ
jgi:DDE family transposase